MKITAIMGSHRSGGHTARLLKHLLAQVAEGNAIDYIDINKQQIKPCMGCDYCADHQRECVLKDDMTAIYDKIMYCDVLIIASPVYFSGFTAKLKNLIDRGQMLFAIQDNGFIPEKKLILIGVGGAPAYPYQFDSMVHTMTYYNRNIKAELVDFIKVAGTDRVPVMENNDALKAVQQCAAYIQQIQNA